MKKAFDVLLWFALGVAATLIACEEFDRVEIILPSIDIQWASKAE